MQTMMINKLKLQVKEFDGKRVITLRDIDTVHERPNGTARRNFEKNKQRFVKDVDYIERNSFEARNEFGIKTPSKLILITEMGYLMLVKSFTDELAWRVQRELVSTYFRVPEPPMKAMLHGQSMVVDTPENIKIQKAMQELRQKSEALKVVLYLANKHLTEEEYGKQMFTLQQLGFAIADGCWELGQIKPQLVGKYI